MESKKRGRPPLDPAEKEKRRIERNQKRNAARKASGWATDKKYRELHPDKVREFRVNSSIKYYSPKINIPRESKPTFDSLLASTGKTISELVLDALEEKYSVNLHADKAESTENDASDDE